MKTYIKPQTEIIEASIELHLMAGSEVIIIDKNNPLDPGQALAPGIMGIEDDDISLPE